MKVLFFRDKLIAIDKCLGIAFFTSNHYLYLTTGADFELGMLWLDSYASESDLWSRLGPNFADPDRLFGKTTETIVHLAGKLGVFVQICQMRGLLVVKLLQFLCLYPLLLIFRSLLCKPFLP
jgi:hypothetical protein